MTALSRNPTFISSHVLTDRRGTVDSNHSWVTPDDHVMILPVNFVLNGETIVVSTGNGDKLDAGREGRALTFEVDALEPALQVEWSVLVIGAAEVITSPAQINRIEQCHLAPCAPLRDWVFIRLPADEITGQRLPLYPGNVTFVRQSLRG